MAEKSLIIHSKMVRWTIAGALALILASIGYFAALWTQSTPEEVQTLAPSTEAERDPIEAFLTERDQLRAMQIAQLNEIIHDADADEETRALARRQVLEVCGWSERESTVEGLLRMRGFEEAVCTVHGDSVNVVIRGQTVTRQESAQIYELVLRETGVTGGNVKIIPVQ